MIELPPSNLSRAKVSEPSRDFPKELRIVVMWTNNKSKTVTIPAAEYYGTAPYGAPMNGERLMQIIGNLLRQKP